jgi:hypothetical protein
LEGKLRRREFLQITAAGAGLMLYQGLSLADSKKSAADLSGGSEDYFIKPARFYKKLEGDIIECGLCPANVVSIKANADIAVSEKTVTANITP